MAGNGPAFVLWGIRIPSSWLGRNFCLLTAKVQKLNRITNADWLCHPAQLAQNHMLYAVNVHDVQSFRFYKCNFHLLVCPCCQYKRSLFPFWYSTLNYVKYTSRFLRLLTLLQL